MTLHTALHINSRAWAHTPRETIARTDHLLNAWGDIFCSLKVSDKLNITFERFIEFPHHYLQRLRSRSLNFRDDRLLDYWGGVFCALEIRRKRRGIGFIQFLETPKYQLALAEEAYPCINQ